MRIQKKIVRLITFKPYSEHTETIFKNLEILNVYQINDFLTSIFMFRYFNLKNLPEIFTNYFELTMRFITTIQEKHPSFINLIIELIMQNTPYRTVELIFGMA